MIFVILYIVITVWFYVFFQIGFWNSEDLMKEAKNDPSYAVLEHFLALIMCAIWPACLLLVAIWSIGASIMKLLRKFIVDTTTKRLESKS